MKTTHIILSLVTITCLTGTFYGVMKITNLIKADTLATIKSNQELLDKNFHITADFLSAEFPDQIKDYQAKIDALKAKQSTPKK